MSTTVQNTFDGIADGTALTAANSATGGTGFITVSPGTGGTLIVRSAGAINGTGSLEVKQGSTACYCYWDQTLLPALPIAYFKFTFTLTALPTAGASVWRHIDGTATEDFRLEILSNGKLRIRNSSTGVILADSTTVFTVGQRYRVEGKVVHGTSGTIEVRIYPSQNAPTAAEVMTPAAVDMGAETSGIHLGRPLSTPTMPTFTLDDVGVTDVGWFGPPVPPAAPVANYTYTTSGLTAYFTDTSTVPSGVTIQSWYWQYGTGQTSAAQNATHAYANPGTYSVTQTITDSLGRTATTTKSVTVTAPAAGATPTANAGPDQTGIEPWTPVQLTGSGTTSGTITGYQWSPPAGVVLSSATAQNPTATFPGNIASKTYVLSLVVTDATGAVSPPDTVSITVLPATEFFIRADESLFPMRVATVTVPAAASQPNAITISTGTATKALQFTGLYRGTVSQATVWEPNTSQWYVTQAGYGSNGTNTPYETTSITRCGANGAGIDSMTLTDAGHGVPLMLEYVGGKVYCWVTWQRAASGGADNDIARFPYAPGIFTRDQVVGLTVPYTATTFGSQPNALADPTNDYVIMHPSSPAAPHRTFMRYKRADFFAGTLTQVGPTIDYYDATTHLLQGWVGIGDSLLVWSGTANGATLSPPDPPGLRQYSWITGQAVATRDFTGLGANPDGSYPDNQSEPEGVSYIYSGGKYTLYLGMTLGLGGANRTWPMFALPLS